MAFGAILAISLGPVASAQTHEAPKAGAATGSHWANPTPPAPAPSEKPAEKPKPPAAHRPEARTETARIHIAWEPRHDHIVLVWPASF